MPWTCSSCGAANSASASHCEACGTLKGGPATPATASSDAAESAVELTRIECTGCGHGFDIAAGLGKGQATCAACGSVLDLSTEEYKVLSKLVTGGYLPKSNIRVGMEATFGDKRYRVLGRLRYSQPDCFWEEWFLVAGDGSILYLEEDDGDFRLLSPFTPSDAPPRTDLEDSKKVVLEIDGTNYTIVERGEAEIEYFEGQIAWRVKAGSRVNYIDARRSGERLAIEWTKRELEYYRGASRTASELGFAFSMPNIVPDRYGAIGSGFRSKSSINVGVIFLYICLFIIVAVIMAQCDGGCSALGGGGGHYSSSGGGGGFGGGK